jgi:hypothetical protein
VTAPRPWLGISTRDWFINSDTPQPGRWSLRPEGVFDAAASEPIMPARGKAGPQAQAGRIAERRPRSSMTSALPP